MSKSDQTLPLVVHVLPVLEPAGAERVVAELAKRLPARGFRTMVICLEDPDAPIGRELREAGVEVRGLRISRRRSWKCAVELRRILPTERPLILHAQLFHANFAARLAATKLQDLLVLSTVQVVERRFRPWQFFFDRITARYAAAEICVSHAVAKFQQEKTGLPAAFFRVIESGIDLAPMKPRAEPILPATSPHVVSVGRLNPQKDFPTLLRAWQKVQSVFPGARLTIAGEGPQRRELERLTESLKLRNVQFPGFIKNIPSLLHQSDVYMQSSAWEGFGLAVAEAMAAELPVVVTNVDSLPELVTDGRTGLVVPVHQPDAMAAAILKLLSDPPGARNLAVAARDEARRRFSVDRMVDDYAAFYRELLALTSARNKLR